MSKELWLTSRIKDVWRKQILPRVVSRKLARDRDAVVEISRLHLWSMRVPGEVVLKSTKLSRRIERRLLERNIDINLMAKLHQDNSGRLVRISIYQR